MQAVKDMRTVIRAAGGVVKLAQAVNRQHATIIGWSRVPAEHVRAVHEVTGIPKHELRPDLFDPPATRHSRRRAA